MPEQLDLRDKVGGLLLEGPKTSAALANELNTPEENVLRVLDELRKSRFVQFAGGEWSITDEYQMQK